MKLNCKLGDLAVIVRADIDPEHIGKIVECVEFVPSHPKADVPHWKTKPKLLRKSTGSVLAWADSSLRPIRDNDGEDETLQWVPRKVEA